MQFNKNYANMFRGRPVRFALPLKTNEKIEKLDKLGQNIVNLSFTSACAYYGNDGSINVIPEMLCNIGCETPTINYNKRSGR